MKKPKAKTYRFKLTDLTNPRTVRLLRDRAVAQQKRGEVLYYGLMLKAITMKEYGYVKRSI